MAPLAMLRCQSGRLSAKDTSAFGVLYPDNAKITTLAPRMLNGATGSAAFRAPATRRRLVNARAAGRHDAPRARVDGAAFSRLYYAVRSGRKNVRRSSTRSLGSSIAGK
jgi:hypothetical protein